MEVSINVYDVASEQEVKEAALDAVRSLVVKQFSGSEENLNRLITNLSYDAVFEMVNKQFDGKLKEILKSKISDIIKNLKSYEVFKRKDAWEQEDSVGYKILQEEMTNARPLIKSRIEEIIKNYPFNELKNDEIGNVVYECIMDRLFKSRNDTAKQ